MTSLKMIPALERIFHLIGFVDLVSDGLALKVHRDNEYFSTILTLLFVSSCLIYLVRLCLYVSTVDTEGYFYIIIYLEVLVESVPAASFNLLHMSHCDAPSSVTIRISAVISLHHYPSPSLRCCRTTEIILL